MKKQGRIKCSNWLMYVFLLGLGLSCSKSTVDVVPAPVAKELLLMTQKGKLTAFDLATYAKAWEVATGFDYPPVVSEGIIYGGYSSIYALNYATGKQIWAYKLDNAVAINHITVIDKVIYVPTNKGKLVALDATTGQKKWSFDAPDLIFSNPCVFNKQVYFGCMDSKVYAVSTETGLKTWEYTTPDFITASPNIFKNTVCVGNWSGDIVGLNPATGTLKWKNKIFGAIYASGAATDFEVMIGGRGEICQISESGYLNSQLLKDNGSETPLVVGETIISVVGKRILGIEKAIFGKIKWENNSYSSIGQPVATDDLLYIPCFKSITATNEYYPLILILDMKTGKMVKELKQAGSESDFVSISVDNTKRKVHYPSNFGQIN
jgi:PQQ-like domain